MITINPKEVSVPKMHSLLLGAVTPRPIAFASTLDLEGNVNLSPFSFFNCFGANPPILVFSPSRRGKNNTTKHTYENVLQVPEVVINVVNYSMVQQTSLASTEYPKGVNEFVKAGLTMVPSSVVKPPRVGESPIAMECKVLQVIPTGNGPAAGNLVLCEILLLHIKEDVLDPDQKIDPFKVDAVARLGGEWYCRVQPNAIFKVPKPLERLGIGVDQLPDHVRNSRVLTGNDLGILANVESLPDRPSIEEMKQFPEVKLAVKSGQEAVHRLAKESLDNGRIEEAWRILLCY